MIQIHLSKMVYNGKRPFESASKSLQKQLLAFEGAMVCVQYPTEIVASLC